MIKIFKLKLGSIIFLFPLLFFTGQTALAWFESSNNPIYDPVNTAEKAYFPSVLKMGANDYRMWYQSNSTSGNATVAYVTSVDGKSWTLVTNEVSGLLLNNAGHPHVEFADGKFRIWYWNTATPYGNNAMHTAESVDGTTWTNDGAITGDLISSTDGIWNSGSYGVVDVIINNSSTNTGTNPFDYKYAMYYDATSGGYEQIALGYSADGIAWTLYGTGPVLPKGESGKWDSGYVTAGTVLNNGGVWEMWYSGGISASNEGIGYATSNDGLTWTKSATNPIMSKNDGIAYRNNRTYTPSIVRDGGVDKMWFTCRDTATSNYAICYATSVLDNIVNGEFSLSSGVSDIILDNTTVLDVSTTVNTVSNGTIIVGGITKTFSSFTSGDLTSVDLSASKDIGGQLVTVGKAVQLSSGTSGTPIILTNSTLASASVSIPDATTILAPSGWDGIIAPPKTGSSSGTAPTGYSIGTAIDVGSPNAVLLFDKPVLVTLSGLTGSVGYKPSGSTTWKQITTACGGTYSSPTLSAASFPGECSISNGTDTKILTYHFTTFGGLTSTLATLHVIKLVINNSGGTGVAADFSIHLKHSGVDVDGSPVVGTVAPGTAYSILPGTYDVSEFTNSLYTQSFLAGDCSNGTITLASGEDKSCTIINTDIPLPPPTVIPVRSSSGGGYLPRIVPLIGISKVPTPLSLPSGPGPVVYNYTVWNVGGLQPLTKVAVVDDKCSPVVFVSGDLNNNKKLDRGEIWKYSCSTILSETTTNTAVVTSHSDDVYNETGIATAVSTIVVGAPILPPLINIVKVPSRITPFPFGGGEVIYTYTVTNPGIVAISNVTVTDDKCSPVSRISGDANANNLLDPSETWVYTCRTNVPVSTRNVATARGQVNGFIALGYAFAMVFVNAPGFPETGNVANLTPAVGKANSTFGQAVSSIAGSLRAGSMGDAVKALQEFLMSHDTQNQALKKYGSDGKFGPTTKASLIKWQLAHGLVGDGVLGPKTKAKMNSVGQ